MEKFVSVIVKLFITREKFYKISHLGGKKGWRKRREREALSRLIVRFCSVNFAEPDELIQNITFLQNLF